jgi:hypothetical protein
MSEISKTTKKLIYDFSRKLTLEYPKDEITGESTAYMSYYVPDDIKIDRSNGNDFILYDEYYWLYHQVLAELKGEIVLEYLKDRELEDAFWHFTCEIIADYQIYKDSKKLKQKIDAFLHSLSKPLEDYEVLIPILNLDVKDSEFKFGDIILKKLKGLFLEEFGIKNESNAFKDNIFEKIVDKTGAIILVKGNSPELVVKRAKIKADLIIRILQTSISTNHKDILYDNNLLFEQGEFIVHRRKIIPSFVGVQYKRKYEPILTEIGKDYAESINKFISNISEMLEEGKLESKLRDRFVRALTWIGRGIEEEDSDIKIIFLSTALETILTTFNDGRKGEALASRMLLLNTIVDKGFRHPANVLFIYELRSEIVHGSKLGTASNKEYFTMLHVTIETLINSIEVIRSKGLKSHTKFIATLDSHDKREQVINWLKKQSDDRSSKIKEHMEKNLPKCISAPEKMS